MDKAYRVVVSRRAAQTLAAHAAFLARVNPEAAERLTAEFEDAARSLESMPHRCPWCNRPYLPQNRYRYLLFGRQYALLYQVRDGDVFIDCVLDCRQAYGFLFP